jgi:hypothetical protein
MEHKIELILPLINSETGRQIYAIRGDITGWYIKLWPPRFKTPAKKIKITIEEVEENNGH